MNHQMKLLPKRKSKFGQKPTITGDSAKGKTSTHDVHWNYPKLDFNDQEKNILFAKALEVGTFKLFSLYVYQFGSRIFKQRKGGPTAATMAASRVVMGIFDQRLAEVMKREKLEVRMRYVDNIWILMKAIKEGWRWENGRLKFKKCWQQEELREGISREKKTSREIKKIMDSIFNNLTFEMETPEMFTNGHLPTLDFECWKENERILYSFYQKEVSKKTLIDRKSALGENMKVASLTQNLVRRMNAEHMSGLLSKQPNNALYKHVTDVHQGELVDFKMKVVRRHQSALFRQVHEAVRLHRISQNSEVKILNSRGEYNRCKLPRLQVAEEFKDPNKQGGGGTKYTLSSKQKKAKSNNDTKIKERNDKSTKIDSLNDDGSQIEFQSNSYSNDSKVDNSKAALQTESKPNTEVKLGEVIKQSRRVYKFVANNYRFKKKYNVEPLSDNRDH